jgi:hypothetical protein
MAGGGEDHQMSLDGGGPGSGGGGIIRAEAAADSWVCRSSLMQLSLMQSL